MSGFTRADNTQIARWWLTVDRWTLGALCLLVGCGYIMVLAASPAVAERIHASREMFIVKQLVFLAVALSIIVAVSMLPSRVVRQLALVGCALALLATAMTLVMGVETKGAARWISIAGNRNAALRSLLAVSRKSTVAPVLSTARYKYFQEPLTFT